MLQLLLQVLFQQLFLKFLKLGKIHKLIEKSEFTTIYYESPFRVLKTLEIIAEIKPEAEVAACNDLTKKFQNVWRGKIKDVIEELKKVKVQGEWVLILKN